MRFWSESDEEKSEWIAYWFSDIFWDIEESRKLQYYSFPMIDYHTQISFVSLEWHRTDRKWLSFPVMFRAQSLIDWDHAYNVSNIRIYVPVTLRTANLHGWVISSR